MTDILRLDYPNVVVQQLSDSPVEILRAGACAKEPWTAAWIEQMQPGEVLYDVGANVGSYSLLAGRLGLHVLAIEPGFANYARLCQNILLNHLEQDVVPVAIALAAQSALVPFRQAPLPGYSDGPEHVVAPHVRLDDLQSLLNLPLPTHIKIDVDGAERGVLMGGTNCLSAAQTVMVEMGHAGDATVICLLRQSGFVHAASWFARSIAYELWTRSTA